MVGFVKVAANHADRFNPLDQINVPLEGDGSLLITTIHNYFPGATKVGYGEWWQAEVSHITPDERGRLLPPTGGWPTTGLHCCYMAAQVPVLQHMPALPVPAPPPVAVPVVHSSLAPVSSPKTPREPNYTLKEDKKIFAFLLRNERWLRMKDLDLWTELENTGQLPGRKAKGLKERFRRNVQMKLETYGLPQQDLEKLRWR